MLLLSPYMLHPFFSLLLLPFTLALSNSQTSLTLLYQNNLNISDDANHVSFIVLDPLSEKDASAACAVVNEDLISASVIRAHQSDFVSSLSYQAYAGRASTSQIYRIDNGVVQVNSARGLTFPTSTNSNEKLPVLCTQSNNANQPGTSVATNQSQVVVAAGGNNIVGFRNQKSFRFLGIPYANPAKRFTYPTLYSPKGQTIQATAYGSQCAQSSGGGSEDCLFLNIQTPYIPKAQTRNRLRPVMFWIHGGGFVGGSGADQLSDGGDLASREDIVVVNINYRLSTLGFLAIPGTNITGNYGIADQITALEWTVKNIASFGGDPEKITIIGESAGAGSVRVLLGSPPAIGKFQRAVAMSNLGGGVGLGLTSDYATTYSSYLTIAESYAIAGQSIFAAAGCNQTSLSAQVDCLTKVPALQVVSLNQNARYVVQDGHYVNTAELDLVNRNGSAANVDVIFGVTANDGASFSTYPKTEVTSELEGIEVSLGITADAAQSIIDSGLFPYYDTGNITLDSFNVSQRVAQDIQFRCIDQATVYAGSENKIFKSSYFYEMHRTIAGYDPNNIGGPPASPGYPYGNPNLPYFRFHGADMPWVFGAFNTGLHFRDDADLYSLQLSVAYFGSFVRTGNPNPPTSYVKARGYDKVLEGIQHAGTWKQVGAGGEQGVLMELDWPSTVKSFADLEQCKWLGYGVDYYIEGGR